MNTKDILEHITTYSMRQLMTQSLSADASTLHRLLVLRLPRIVAYNITDLRWMKKMVKMGRGNIAMVSGGDMCPACRGRQCYKAPNNQYTGPYQHTGYTACKCRICEGTNQARSLVWRGPINDS